MKNLRIKEIIIALALASFLIACGGDNKNNNNPPTPAVTITIAPKTATTAVGTARSFTVTVTGSTNTGYTVSATPAGSGCPSGAQSGNTLNCTPTEAAEYTITVTASADTTKTDTATLTATAVVNDWPPAPTESTTQCTEPIGTGTNRARIAVAANFRIPAQELVRDLFQESSFGADTSIVVCSDSTTNLIREINNGNVPEYKMLFAADESAGTLGDGSFVYAKGVPILGAQKDVIPNISGLITGAPEPTDLKYDITEGSAAELSAKYEINTASAEKVSLADVTAPYGLAAHLILNRMMSENIPDDIPEWVFTDGNQANGLWNNIDRTYDAIVLNSVTVSGTTYPTDDVKSGIFAKSTICGEIAPRATAPAWVYVGFTHPDFIRNQKAILLDTENPAASSLNDYIQSAISGGEWADFLDYNCYLPLD